MLQRLRFAIAHTGLEKKLTGKVEVDETYIGGLEKFKHKNKRVKNAQGRSVKSKIPVLSIVQRRGMVFSQTIRTVSSKNIKMVLDRHVSKKAILNTDTFPAYVSIGEEYRRHRTVDHRVKEYVNGDSYTNTVEGYFSQLKRSLSGTFHSVSAKHLDRYLAEFDYRYNTRGKPDGIRMVKAIKCTGGRRLQYKDLIGK